MMSWSSIVLLLLGVACFDASLGLESPLKYHKYFRSQHATPNHEEQFQKHIDDLWERHTRESEDPPSFYSETFQSTIIGKEMMTINERVIYAFQGFRYGQEPTIETRFKPPIAAGKFWDGDTFTATHIGFKCPQSSMIGHNPSGEEDCLYLNVYTPYLPTEGKKLPVMFFIHGGAYTTGDASMYLPTKLLDHDVILVTIHYRLGILGFFTTNTRDAPGNPALYDMVEALRWVQTYIDDFGGDKDQVTIFGESAGSVSVNYMMLVPEARGMFKGVIAESGSALDVWALDENPLETTEYIANYFNCPTDDMTELFNCVVKQDAYDLVKAGNSLVSKDRHSGLIGFRGASPCIQTAELTDDDDYELLVTKYPREYLRQGDFAKVPFMTGSNKQEGSFVLGIMYGDYFVYHGLQDNATYMQEQMVQDILRSYGVQDDTYSLANSLTLEYCWGVNISNFDEAANCLIDMVGVLYLKAGSWETSKLHAYYSDQDSFYYAFEFESDDTMFIWLLGSPSFTPGVTHSDELMYIFSMPALMDNDPQVKTMDRMTRMWTNFAIYGHPTPPEDQENLDALNIPFWSPTTYDDPHYMLIESELTVSQDYTERWTITMDDIRADAMASSSESSLWTDPSVTVDPCDPDVCRGVCLDIRDQRDAYEITMIVFIVAFVVADLAATYFFFKARR